MAKVPPVKGTRDFYPDLMAVRNWIIDGWRSASLRSGFVEYDGPIFEHLQLYTQKSGEGIVSELFAMTDRGGRELAIRPEMTPTLARMINQQINTLSRPIKWFSVPRCCRAERPQKGRLREFFQWNVDVVATDAVLADAECIYVALDYLRSVGLTPADVEARISSRALLAGLLTDAGFEEKDLPGLYALLDKRPKVPDEAFQAMVAEQVTDLKLRERLMQLQAVGSLEELDGLVHTEAARRSLDELRELFGLLEQMHVGDYCRFDISIVRGLAYYTGPVFEIFDRSTALRAVGAGGRYDNLLAGLGGPQLSGTGFGMGDVVLGIMLEEKGLLKPVAARPDCFIIDADPELFPRVLDLACQLRGRGWAAVFDYKRSGVGKQLKQAAALGAKQVIILGEETRARNEITVKDMDSQSQRTMVWDDFLAEMNGPFSG